MKLKWTKVLIVGYSLVVDALILHNLVDDCCQKLQDELKMKMVILVLKKWPNDYKSG